MQRQNINPPPRVVDAVETMTKKVRGPNIKYDEGDIFTLGAMGCTQGELADFYGTRLNHFESALANHPNLKRAWQQGTANAKLSVRRLQMAHAQERGAPGVAMTIHLSKHWLGEKDEIKQVHTSPQEAPVRMEFSFTRGNHSTEETQS
jgi:hypothetical protein